MTSHTVAETAVAAVWGIILAAGTTWWAWQGIRLLLRTVRRVTS